MYTLITSLSTLSQILQQCAEMSQWIYSSAQYRRVSESEVCGDPWTLGTWTLEAEGLMFLENLMNRLPYYTSSWTAYLTTHHEPLTLLHNIMNRLPYYATSWTAYLTTQHHEPLTLLRNIMNRLLQNIMNRLPYYTASWTAYLTTQHHEPLILLHSITPHKTIIPSTLLQEPHNLHRLPIVHFVTNN
jgi:hypothetical protein